MIFLVPVFLIFNLICFEASARGDGPGVAFDGSIGLPTLSVENPDNSKAHYSGVALAGRVHFPIYSNSPFSSSLLAGLKYLDLKNNANSGDQKELVNQIGPTVGLRLQYAKLFVQAEYAYMLARHYSVGTVSRELSFNYSGLQYGAGLQIPLGTLSLGASYQISNGTYPAAKTGLSEDSAYSESLVMFHLVWNTGAGLSQFFLDLFR